MNSILLRVLPCPDIMYIWHCSWSIDRICNSSRQPVTVFWKHIFFKDSVGRYRRNADINFPVRRVGGRLQSICCWTCVCSNLGWQSQPTEDRQALWHQYMLGAWCAYICICMVPGIRRKRAMLSGRMDGWMVERQREKLTGRNWEKIDRLSSLLFAPTLFYFSSPSSSLVVSFIFFLFPLSCSIDNSWDAVPYKHIDTRQLLPQLRLNKETAGMTCRLHTEGLLLLG
jgi:hypothetical protein